MKILAPGKLPPENDIIEVFQGTCWRCSARVEASREDNIQESGGLYAVTCPTKGCGVGIFLKRIVTEIPRAC